MANDRPPTPRQIDEMDRYMEEYQPRCPACREPRNEHRAYGLPPPSDPVSPPVPKVDRTYSFGPGPGGLEVVWVKCGHCGHLEPIDRKKALPDDEG